MSAAPHAATQPASAQPAAAQPAGAPEAGTTRHRTPRGVPIEVAHLTKIYGDRSAVDDVTFTARPGAITALLGPNGSGKSTTLRMMVGLARPTHGTAHFGGRPYVALERPGETVGILLDASAQHAGRSVRESARLAGLLAGVSPARVDQCLTTVGLGDVGRRRVGALSLGMRQRLGLAVALLGSPGALILDEPANGLDPEGIAWLNDYLTRFAHAGGTVLISSHHLAEIEAIADDIVMLDRGRVQHSGSAETLTTRTLQAHATSTDDARLLDALRRAEIPARPAAGGGILADAPPAAIGLVSLESGIPLTGLTAVRPSLQQFFLDSTNGEYQGRHDDLMALTDAKEVPR